MTKEELVQFLKENLSIRIDRKYGSFGYGNCIEVELILDGTVISKDSMNISDQC